MYYCTVGHFRACVGYMHATISKAQSYVCNDVGIVRCCWWYTVTTLHPHTAPHSVSFQSKNVIAQHHQITHFVTTSFSVACITISLFRVKIRDEPGSAAGSALTTRLMYSERWRYWFANWRFEWGCSEWFHIRQRTQFCWHRIILHCWGADVARMSHDWSVGIRMQCEAPVCLISISKWLWAAEPLFHIGHTKLTLKLYAIGGCDACARGTWDNISMRIGSVAATNVRIFAFTSITDLH